MKKYLGKNPLNTLMGIMLDVIPSKELSEDTDIQRMWDKLNIKPAPIGSESNWNYTLDDVNNTVTLKNYIGSETNVTVYGRYQINGKEYDTKITNNGSPYKGLFNKDNNSNCENIQSITFNEGIDTSECTNMNQMFRSCKALITINGLENLDTSNVTDMSNMFNSCNALTSLDLRGWDTSKVTNMIGMFRICKSLTSLDLRGWDTSKVTNMTSMFEGCQSLISIDVSSFNTSECTNMNQMFRSCTLLTELDLRSFDTSNVTDMGYMFDGCSKLTEIKVATGKWIIQSGCDTDLIFRSCGVSAVTYYPAA